MERGWPYPRNYQSAVKHVTKYQKNRLRIKLENNTVLRLKWRDGEKFADVEHYGTTIVKYHEDGRLQIFKPGYSRSTNDRINRYATKRLTGLDYGKKGPRIVLDECKPGREMKCRECHGYVWQGEETENILFQLVGGTQPNPDTGWARYYMNEEEKLHYKPCFNCGGNGRAIYGANRIEVPAYDGMFINPVTGYPSDYAQVG
jgi:hypothetical protein